MISDTLQIFCHHDQIHDPAAPLPFIDRDIIYHLFPDIVKEAIHFIIFQHYLARKLQIFLYIRCDAVAHHLTYNRCHSSDILDIYAFLCIG